MPKPLFRTALALGAIVLSLGLGACGDDDDPAVTDTTAGDQAAAGDDVTEYCQFSASLDEGDELPSDEELDRLEELAPAEISSEVELLVAEIQEKGEAAFSEEGSDEFFAALETVEAYEEEHCGRDDVDTEEAPAETDG